MKKIIILQNSNVSFDLNAQLIHQPDKYHLCLIVNKFGHDVMIARDQMKYYETIIITDDFSVDNIAKCIGSIRDGKSEFNIITNSEETMPLCGKIRVLMGLDNEDYSRFYDKDVMKKRLAGSGAILLPKYKLFEPTCFRNQGIDYLNALIKDMTYPLFIKPVALYSSINLKKVHNLNELVEWANTNNSDALYEIDEFIDGIMYHCDSYIKDKKILFTFISRNSRPCYNFTVGEMKGTIVLPSDHPDALLLSKTTENVLHDLGIPDGGVTHMEVIKTPDDCIYFIEIAHRSPGCLIPKMYQAHARINTIASHYLLQIDSEFIPKPEFQIYAAWACYPKKPGTITNLRKLSDTLKSTTEVHWLYNVGDKINSFSQYGRDYTGTVFITNINFEDLDRDFMSINNENLCDIKSVDHKSVCAD